MRTKATSIGAALAALGVLCALFAASASAAPAWKFESKALEGTETIVGGALSMVAYRIMLRIARLPSEHRVLR